MKGGTVYKEGNKWVWKSSYYLEDGKKKRHRQTFDTEEQALAKQAAYLFQLKGGIGNNFIVGLTVRQAYEKWVAIAWAGNEEYISFNTQKNYVSAFRLHILPYIGDLKIDNINPVALNLHFKEMKKQGKSYKTVFNVRQALMKLLEYSEDVGWIDVYNPAKIKMPKNFKSTKNKRVVNNISHSEYDKLYEHLHLNCSKFAPLIKFLRWTGLRIEEAGAIKESDIIDSSLLVCRSVKRKGYEDGHTELVVSEYLKNDSAYRLIPLPKQALKAIEEQKEIKADLKIKSEWLFCTGTGKPREERNVLRAVHDACDAIGIEHRGPHCFRKLYCKTLIDDACAEWEQVRIIMGHKDVSVTKKWYYDIDKDDVANIASKLSKVN